MTDPDPWIPQVGRVYIEAREALERNKEEDYSQILGSSEYARQFNTLLLIIQKSNTEDPVIQSIKQISGESSSGGKKHSYSVMTEVLLKSGRLIDYLGYTIPEDQLIKSNSNVPIIHMVQENQQEQTASLSANVSIESVMNSIEHSRTTPAEQEELEDIVKDFESELSKEDPDQSRIRRFIQTAADKSTDVGAKLLMIALYHGILRAAPLLDKV